MAGTGARRRKRQRGSVEELPSGALRVSVYAGIDPVSKRRHYLKEVVPAGPKAAAEADKVIRRLAGQVDEKRHPRTSATVDQMLDRHFELATLEQTTLSTYTGYANKHIRPLIGPVKVGSLDADVFDSFYAELRRCRDHCDRRPYIDHRTTVEHVCDARCKRHVCRPLGASSVRQVHFILSGALKRAVRWRWISTSPITQAEPPAAPRPDPQPPNAADAARILNEAWADPDWGTLVWLAMVTGARRGELCALRWEHLDPAAGVLAVRRSIWQRSKAVGEKDTKDHQKRRVALDPETLAVLASHRRRWEERAESLGVELREDAFMFSLAPDGSAHLLPDSVSQRYSDLVARLGVHTTIHKLRHYSATELISAGVDARTVAGRLGHGGGGTTTLRYYTAWVSESDQRAASTLTARMPDRPAEGQAPPRRKRALHPYELLADVLRQAIVVGTYPPGALLPGQKVVAADSRVSVGTAHRAVSLLAERGYVEVVPGRGFRVVDRVPDDAVDERRPDSGGSEPVSVRQPNPIREPSNAVLLDLVVLRHGQVVSKFSAAADPRDAADLRQVLLDSVQRRGGDESQIAQYEMELRYSGDNRLLTTFVTSSRPNRS